MTDKELKTLKDNLWHAADVLRSGAHLAANKYGQPILGLIFLRYADILFKQHKDKIEEEYAKRLGTRMEKTRKEISIEKCGFFLPECAYYDYLNDAPDTAAKADLVKKAMEAIERENPKMDGVLPKEVYAQLVPEEEPELLSNIVRIFKDIPENCTVDIFGEIYEYFLGNFALAEGKDGGTFYRTLSLTTEPTSRMQSAPHWSISQLKEPSSLLPISISGRAVPFCRMPPSRSCLVSSAPSSRVISLMIYGRKLHSF